MEYEFGKIDRLNKSLVENNVDMAILIEIMKDGEKVLKTSSNKTKSIWFYDAMNKMDKLLEIDQRKKIREDCACCLTGKRSTLCKKVNKSYNSVEEKINAINDTHSVFGNEIKITGPGKYEVSFFPEYMELKKCVCLRDLDKPMSITYCYCCGGHVKHHLETVLGKSVSVKVISSALSSQGKKNCHFELREV
jgi:hypothetical protein